MLHEDADLFSEKIVRQKNLHPAFKLFACATADLSTGSALFFLHFRKPDAELIRMVDC